MFQQYIEVNNKHFTFILQQTMRREGTTKNCMHNYAKKDEQ